MQIPQKALRKQNFPISHRWGRCPESTPRNLCKSYLSAWAVSTLTWRGSGWYLRRWCIRKCDEIRIRIISFPTAKWDKSLEPKSWPRLVIRPQLCSCRSSYWISFQCRCVRPWSWLCGMDVYDVVFIVYVVVFLIVWYLLMFDFFRAARLSKCDLFLEKTEDSNLLSCIVSIGYISKFPSLCGLLL